jgi:hypothetical protein
MKRVLLTGLLLANALGSNDVYTAELSSWLGRNSGKVASIVSLSLVGAALCLWQWSQRNHAVIRCDGDFRRFTDESDVRVLEIRGTNIPERACQNWRELSEVKIADVGRIGPQAFENCQKLRSVDITGGEFTIGGGAFWGCLNLQNVNIEGQGIIMTLAFTEIPNLTACIKGRVEITQGVFFKTRVNADLTECPSIDLYAEAKVASMMFESPPRGQERGEIDAVSIGSIVRFASGNVYRIDLVNGRVQAVKQ